MLWCMIDVAAVHCHVGNVTDCQQSCDGHAFGVLIVELHRSELIVELPLDRSERSMNLPVWNFEKGDLVYMVVMFAVLM